MPRAIWALLLLALAGCTVGPWGGPAYDFNPFMIGSGESVFTPSQFDPHNSGDYRTHH